MKKMKRRKLSEAFLTRKPEKVVRLAAPDGLEVNRAWQKAEGLNERIVTIEIKNAFWQPLRKS